MIFARFLPPLVRSNYRWDARSGWLTGLYAGMTLPFFGVIARRDLHASALEIGLLISAPFLGHLLSMLVAWHMQSRPKMPYVLWFGMLARGLMLFMAFAYTTPLFIALIIASQILGCFTVPAYSTIMKDVYPDASRGRLMGLVRVGVTFASMLAGLSAGQLMEQGLPAWWTMALVAGAALLIAHELQTSGQRVLVAGALLLLGWFGAPVLAQPLSYRLVFPVAAVLGMLAFWMFRHLPEAQPEEAPPRRFHVFEGFATLIADRKFGLYSLAFFIFGFGNLLQNPLIPIFQVDALHITDQWVGLLVMISCGVSTLFYYIWGRVMDRSSPFFVVIISFALYGCSPFVYAHAQTLPFLILASVITGIALPAIDLTWLNAVLDFTDRDGIPRYAATHTFLVGIRGLIAPFVGAWLVHAMPLRSCFYVAAAIIWLGALLMTIVVVRVIRPRSRRRRPAPARVVT